MRESKRHVRLFHPVLAHPVTVFLSLEYRTSNFLHPRHLTPSKQSALHLCRAQAHLNAGSTDEAARDINEAINLRPGCPKGWILKGKLQQQSLDFTEAAHAFVMASKV